jgi:hypothetical protein
MSTPARQSAAEIHAEIIPMLDSHLAANVRSVEREITRNEKKLAELRDKLVKLKQIAVAAGIPLNHVTGEDAPAEGTP